MSVVIALAGMYLLCIKESFAIARGDIYILICAFVFAIHIMAVDYFAPKVDGVSLSCGVAYTFRILGQRNYNPSAAIVLTQLPIGKKAGQLRQMFLSDTGKFTKYAF